MPDAAEETFMKTTLHKLAAIKESCSSRSQLDRPS